jgi:hypothetical protein
VFISFAENTKGTRLKQDFVEQKDIKGKRGK